MKLCAVLIPTRLRPDRLARTVDSVFATSDPDYVEVLIRYDFDDFLTHHQLIQIKDKYGDNVRCIVGPRKNGYTSLCEFYTELAEATLAKWIFLINDDITIEGDGWHQQLRAIPSAGVYVQPEFYHLGGSKYGSGSCDACPIVPNGCWRHIRRDLVNQVDNWLRDILTKEMKWKTELLRGMTVNHQRDSDQTIIERNKL